MDEDGGTTEFNGGNVLEVMQFVAKRSRQLKKAYREVVTRFIERSQQGLSGSALFYEIAAAVEQKLITSPATRNFEEQSRVIGLFTKLIVEDVKSGHPRF